MRGVRYETLVLLIFFASISYFLFSMLHVPNQQHVFTRSSDAGVGGAVFETNNRQRQLSAPQKSSFENVNINNSINTNNNENNDNNVGNHNNVQRISPRQQQQPDQSLKRATSPTHSRPNANNSNNNQQQSMVKSKTPPKGTSKLNSQPQQQQKQQQQPHRPNAAADGDDDVLRKVNARLKASSSTSSFDASISRHRTPQQILVLGMHHSGTSLLARALTLMGVYGGLLDDFHLMKGAARCAVWR
jgi:hypothetical protein